MDTGSGDRPQAPARNVGADPLMTDKYLWPLTVWELADGSFVAIVRDLPRPITSPTDASEAPNPSLMSSSDKILAAVRERYPDARVIEHWPDDQKIGPYRESSGGGGGSPVNPEVLRSLGIPI